MLAQNIDDEREKVNIDQFMDILPQKQPTNLAEYGERHGLSNDQIQKQALALSKAKVNPLSWIRHHRMVKLTVKASKKQTWYANYDVGPSPLDNTP